MHPPASDTATRVIIVDDHRMFADSLVRLLNDEPDLRVVGLASSIADAVRATRSLQPDVVLLDFRLPDGDAPECVARLREVMPAARVLIMTGLNDQATMSAARNAGCPVLTKDRAAADLIAALRAVAADSTDLGDAELPGRTEGEAHLPLLTDRERALLAELAHGLSTREIADVLHISPTTVRNHVQRILAKLDAHSRLEAVAVAIQKGIIPPPAREP